MTVLNTHFRFTSRTILRPHPCHLPRISSRPSIVSSILLKLHPKWLQFLHHMIFWELQCPRLARRCSVPRLRAPAGLYRRFLTGVRSAGWKPAGSMRYSETCATFRFGPQQAQPRNRGNPPPSVLASPGLGFGVSSFVIRRLSPVENLRHSLHIIAMSQQFESFTASELLCPKCGRSQPVRERLLLVLPSGELHEFLCTTCGTSLGKRTVTGPAVAPPTRPRPPRRSPRHLLR